MIKFLKSKFQMETSEKPTIFWSVFAKNAEIDLPLYLKCVLHQTYPKDKIYLYFRTNDNNDKTLEIIRNFKEKYQSEFREIYVSDDDVDSSIREARNHDWNSDRVKIMAGLRQESISYFQKLNYDFYFTSDVDNFLLPETLSNLATLNLPIVAPMLRRPWVDGQPVALYSNFHLKVTNEMFYESDPHTLAILERRIRGVFQVPLVHCTYLVQKSVITKLGYEDSVIDWEYKTFAKSAMKNGIPMYLDNREVYGVISLGDSIDAVIETLDRFSHQITLKRACFQVMHVPMDRDTTTRRRAVQKEIIEKLSPEIDFFPLLSTKLDNDEVLPNTFDDKMDRIHPDIRFEGQYLLPRIRIAAGDKAWLLGEIGKWGTFLRALKEFCESSKEYLLLLADDLWLSDDFTRHLSEVISGIHSKTALVSLYSFEGRINCGETDELLISAKKVLVSGKFASAALLWTRDAAQSFVHHFQECEISQSIEDFLLSSELFELFIVNPAKQQCSVYTVISNQYSTVHAKNAKSYKVQGKGELVPYLPKAVDLQLDLSPEEKKWFKKCFSNFKSQNFQDLFALKYSNFKDSGYFVEFGACDGELLSNTYVLEKNFGWTGLLAEPASIWHENLARNRNCSIVHNAITDVTGEILELLIPQDSPEVSTLLKFNHDFMQEYRARNSRRELVRTLSINDFLKSGNAPKHIDYMSIDTEGSEFFVLNSLDFDYYSFGFLTVEHNNSPLKKEIIKLMKSKGYVQVHEEISKVDSWFVPAESEK